MTRNWITTTCTNLLLAFVASLLFLQPPVCNGAAWQETTALVINETSDERGGRRRDEEEEEELVQNNPWGIDERNLKAAELFWFRKMFAIEVLKIKSVCELDKKQTLKLKVAIKGAAKKELKGWKKKWDAQMQQFRGGNFGRGNQQGKKRKRKEVVIKNADEIDQQTMQYLNNTSMLGGDNEEVQAAIDSVFWRKTVKSVLTPAQFTKYKSFLAERKKAQVDAKIDAFILKMKEDLGLTDKQTTQYDALVRNKLEKAPNFSGYYSNYVFPYYATKYDKKKMKALLDADQYQLMRMILGPSESYGAMFDRQANNNAVEVNANLGMFGSIMQMLEGYAKAVENFTDGFKSVVDGIANLVGAK